jgi:hypothetical protein
VRRQAALLGRRRWSRRQLILLVIIDVTQTHAWDTATLAQAVCSGISSCRRVHPNTMPHTFRFLTLLSAILIIPNLSILFITIHMRNLQVDAAPRTLPTTAACARLQLSS